MDQRDYPVILEKLPSATRPVSFVCVRFSGDYHHNITKSACVSHPMNQLVTVNNEENLFFPTLSAAMVHGIENAEHDLIAVVHEDVLLPNNWHARLEASLKELEVHDPSWGLAGSVGQGVTPGTGLIGHFSDPHRPVPINTFETQNFQEAIRLDEQILIFRKSILPLFDPHLPTIHNIGRDLVFELSKRNLKTYVVNAPTIHKYADAKGDLIQTAAQSPKIVDRKSLAYLADKAVSDDYMHRKWTAPETPPKTLVDTVTPQQTALLDKPTILLGRGGGATRLISIMAQDAQLFLGNNINPSGDSIDMVDSIYQAVFRRHQSPHSGSKDLAIEHLRLAAASMLNHAEWPANWGFKLPETALILPELRAAFPNARYIHFERAAKDTVFRRSHMTARLDNHIGRTALTAAYDFFGLERSQILTDGQFMRMAVTTCHQNQSIWQHLESLPADRHLLVSFNQTMDDPEKSLQDIATFLRTDIASRQIMDTVDPERAQSRSDDMSSVDASAALDFIQRHGDRDALRVGRKLPNLLEFISRLLGLRKT